MICVSIGNVSFKECLKIIRKNEMAEIRLDLLDFSIDQIKELFTSTTIPLIATCRPDNMTEKEQVSILKTAIESGAKYIDLEYEAKESYRNKLISVARKNDCQVIVSYHNFENTPHMRFLQAVVNECFAFGADLAKIATMVLEERDNAKISALYATGKRIVAFGMGKIGRVSRIASLYMGAEFSYAAVDEENATAPGQYTVKQFEELRKII